MAHGDVRHRQVKGNVQTAKGKASRGGHPGRGGGCLGAEFELDGGTVEEPIWAVQHAQLEQLDLSRRLPVVRHGRQYTHAPMSLPSGLQAAVAARHERFLTELEALVNIDCGSYTPDGVNRVADAVAASLVQLGATIERIAHQPEGVEPRFGDLVIGRLAGDGPRLLLIGHMDTVFEPGTAAVRPFRRAGDRALGPGVSDMKGGLLAGLHALGALQEVGHRASVTFVANPDEEIGSPFSTPHIRALAVEHDAVFVLECARANGFIVSARKGIADYEVTLTGRAAHAGVEPEKGRNAILAAAEQIVALHALNGRWPSVTLNAGVIQGGTRPNVVAASCRYELDLRAATAVEFDAAAAEVARLVGESSIAGVTAELRRSALHPPMERSTAAARLAGLATVIARELGFELQDASTGGASDANTTAALGLPTLDGLGPIGGDDHSADEWLDLSSVIPRIMLLAALIVRVGEAL
jgi:glutamate carboxypeptidase